MANQSQLADRVREAIEDSGTNQAAVARAAKVSPAAVSGWATGKIKDIRLDNLFALADATGYSARWIATGAGQKHDPRPPHDRERIFLEQFRQLDPDTEQQDVLQYLEFLRAKKGGPAQSGPTFRLSAA